MGAVIKATSTDPALLSIASGYPGAALEPFFPTAG